MKGKSVQDMQRGAPLACSRCLNRFWTYEGLERHMVMAHDLVTNEMLQKAQKKEDAGRCKIYGKHLVADHSVKLCSAEITYSWTFAHLNAVAIISLKLIFPLCIYKTENDIRQLYRGLFKPTLFSPFCKRVETPNSIVL